MPHPILSTSIRCPAWVSRASRAAVVIPLSSTWVRPRRRGFWSRSGSSRKFGQSHTSQRPRSPFRSPSARTERRTAPPRRRQWPAGANEPASFVLPGHGVSAGSRPSVSDDGRERLVHQRLVVVGAGAAGMSAASAARRLDPDLDIVVLEAGGYAAYGMCGLPYYLSGVVARAETLLAYPASFFREQRRLDLRLHTTVTRVDAERHVVHFRENERDTRLDYHRLIV